MRIPMLILQYRLTLIGLLNYSGTICNKMVNEQGIQLTDENIEIILKDLLEYHGYDFTGYSRASLKRRITRSISSDHFEGFAEFRFRLLEDKEYFNRFVEQITVNVTEMFRDANFYKTLREEVLPMLATWPMIRI